MIKTLSSAPRAGAIGSSPSGLPPSSESRAPQLQDYVRSVVKADLEEKGDEDVFRKIRNDFAAAGVKISDTELRAAMGELLAKAVADIEEAGKALSP